MSRINSTRNAIVAAAGELFYAQGLREVSMDRIAEVAGVTKKTVYYHFRSKDDLIAAYLSDLNSPTLERYKRWAGDAGSAQDRVERMFQNLAKAAKASEWKGCGFIRAAVELADQPGHPALDAARHHKTTFEAWLRRDLSDAGYAEAESLAAMLMVLLDGAVARMIVSRDAAYADTAAQAARALLAHD